jgi:hypothetical protein
MTCTYRLLGSPHTENTVSRSIACMDFQVVFWVPWLRPCSQWPEERRHHAFHQTAIRRKKGAGTTWFSRSYNCPPGSTCFRLVAARALDWPDVPSNSGFCAQDCHIHQPGRTDISLSRRPTASSVGPSLLIRFTIPRGRLPTFP